MPNGKGMTFDATCLRALETHRSIRHFKPEPIPPRDLQRMMAAAVRASTGGSGQLYSFVRLSDIRLRQHIAEALAQRSVAEAPEFFVTCLDVFRLQRLLEFRELDVGKPRQILYAIIDAVLATANLATAAEALGYGICYIGSIQRVLDEVIDLLQLPEGVCPLLGLCVGYPDESPGLSPRLPVKFLFHENRYREPTADDLEQCYEAMASVTYAGGWFNSLSQSFTTGQEYEQRQAHWRRALVRQGFQVTL